MDTKKIYHIFKYGGKSTSNISLILNYLVNFIKEFSSKLPENHVLVIVLSAFGKGTNALEYHFNKKLRIENPSYINPQDFADGDVYKFFSEFADFLAKGNHGVLDMFWNELDVELGQIIDKTDSYFINKMKARVLSKGEIISAELLSYYLNSQSIKHALVNAHKHIYTNSDFTSAELIYEKTYSSISKELSRINEKVIITQGFIARDANANLTNFPRNCSDYTASIWAAITEADGFVLCKDEIGVYHPSDEIRKGNPIPYLSYGQAPGFMNGVGGTFISKETIQFSKNNNLEIRIAHYKKPVVIGTRIGP